MKAATGGRAVKLGGFIVVSEEEARELRRERVAWTLRLYGVDAGTAYLLAGQITYLTDCQTSC